MDMQTDVGIGNGYVGAHPRLLTELVGNGILYLVSNEFGVPELLGEHHGVNSKCLLVIQILCPVDRLHFLIDVVGTLCFEMLDGLEDSDGCMQLEISAIHHFLVARERYHATTNLYVVCS